MNGYLAILPGLSGLICLGLAAFVLTRNPKHPSNIGFALGMSSLALMEAGETISFLSGMESSWFLRGKRISLAGEILLSPAWLLFSLTFARSEYHPILARWKYALWGTSFLSILFILWLPSPQMIFLSDDSVTLGAGGRLFFIFLILGMVINLIHLENTLRSATGSDRWQIKYPLVGVGSILAFQIYMASQILLYSRLDQRISLAFSAILLIAAGMMTVFIIRHRLLGADVFISRYVIYNSLTVLLVGGYLFFIGLAAQGIRWYGGEGSTLWIPVFSFLAILGGAILFLSDQIRRKFQLFISRNFYKHKHEFRDKWMETTERLGSANTLNEIQKALFGLIKTTLVPRELSLYLFDSESKEFRLTESTAGSDRATFPENHLIVERCRGTSAPFFLSMDIPREEIPANMILCSPLAAGQALVGFLLLGEDLGGTPYGSDDFEILTAITTQAANQIINIHLSQALLAAKEAEAFHHVSSFFIHDLKNFVSTLSLLVENAEEHMGDPAFQEEAIRTLKTTVAKMNAMISRLGLLAKRLELKPQPSNLNDLLEETLIHLNGQLSFRTEKQLGSIGPILLDAEQIRKVILNLLLNAIEASPPSGKVLLKTYTENGFAILSVTDQGCGMSKELMSTSLFKPFRSTKPNGLGIGLFQCRKIMEGHKGRIEVESEEGQGSEFKLIFPLGNETRPE